MVDRGFPCWEALDCGRPIGSLGRSGAHDGVRRPSGCEWLEKVPLADLGSLRDVVTVIDRLHTWRGAGAESIQMLNTHVVGMRRLPGGLAGDLAHCLAHCLAEGLAEGLAHRARSRRQLHRPLQRQLVAPDAGRN
jgi:hypothetical protein